LYSFCGVYAPYNKKLKYIGGIINMRELENNSVVQSLNLEFLHKVVKEWNKLNYWCSLEVNKNEVLILKNKKFSNKIELLGLDDIDLIVFKDEALDIWFDEDEDGNDFLTIDKYGITI
jgi:hypothetical protein